MIAYAGPNYPAPTPVRAFERELWPIGERANSADVWYVVGDHFLHRYLLSGDTTGPHRALDAFRKAEALDSSFVPALEHQSSLYSIFGDTAAERAAWQRQRMLDSTGDFFFYTDAYFRATSGTIDQALQVRTQYKKSDSNVLRFASRIWRSVAHRRDYHRSCRITFAASKKQECARRPLVAAAHAR